MRFDFESVNVNYSDENGLKKMGIEIQPPFSKANPVLLR
jgi:hypothetical protein